MRVVQIQMVRLFSTDRRATHTSITHMDEDKDMVMDTGIVMVVTA